MTRTWEELLTLGTMKRNEILKETRIKRAELDLSGLEVLKGDMPDFSYIEVYRKERRKTSDTYDTSNWKNRFYIKDGSNCVYTLEFGAKELAEREYKTLTEANKKGLTEIQPLALVKNGKNYGVLKTNEPMLDFNDMAYAAKGLSGSEKRGLAASLSRQAMEKWAELFRNGMLQTRTTDISYWGTRGEWTYKFDPSYDGAAASTENPSNIGIYGKDAKAVIKGFRDVIPLSLAQKGNKKVSVGNQKTSKMGKALHGMAIMIATQSRRLGIDYAEVCRIVEDSFSAGFEAAYGKDKDFKKTLSAHYVRQELSDFIKWLEKRPMDEHSFDDVIDSPCFEPICEKFLSEEYEKMRGAD